MSDYYQIVRRYFKKPGRKRVIIERVSLSQAQAWCSDPETSSSTCTQAKGRAVTRRNGPWFDSYERM